MSVEFEENNYNSRNFQNDFGPKGLAGWLIKKGLVKDEAGATRLQVIAAIIFFLLSFYFFFF